jgi:nickel-dependent lactate racemase
MMTNLTINLPYGSGYQSITIPKEQLVGVIKPQPVEALVDLRSAVKNAIESSFGRNLFQSLSPSDTVAIVIDDKTRPVPNREILEVLIEELLVSKVMPKNIKIVVATGVHPSCTREDIDRMLGPGIANRFSIMNHSAWDEKNLIGLGPIGGKKTFQLQINKHVAEADVKILIGMIGPHHAAGYSGGRKSILPGVASFENIRNQHNIHPDRIMLGKLNDNPFHSLAMEAAEKVGVNFIVNVVLNNKGEVAKVVAGDLVDAWSEGVAFCNKISKAILPDYSDIVITSPGGYPRDINLWQSQKAISTAELIVRPGGVIILVAECREGIGSEDLHQWLKTASRPQDIIERFNQIGFTGGSRKAYYFARALQKADIILVSDKLSKQDLKGMLLLGANSIKEALEIAKDRIGGFPSISILPYAPGLILEIKNTHTVSKRESHSQGHRD